MTLLRRLLERPERLISAVLALGLAAYLAVIAMQVSPHVGGSDSASYFHNAMLLDQGRLVGSMRTLPGLEGPEFGFVYSPLGLVPRPGSDELVPAYPMGVPLLLWATAKVVGWSHAAAWTAALHAVAGLVVCVLLGRQYGLPRTWAAYGALLIAANPLYLFMGLHLMSDVPSVVWCAAAVSAALASQRNDRWALVAGLCTGMAVLIRPTNLLIALPVAVALGLDWKRWACLILGGAPFAGFLAWYNLHVYGAVATTGYGAMSPAFSTRWIGPTFLHYARWLPVLLTPVVLLGVLLPREGRGQSRLIAVSATWAAAFFGLYSVYLHTHQSWWYLRFILPATPPLVFSGLFVLRSLLARLPRQRPLLTRPAAWPAAALLVALTVVLLRYECRKLGIWQKKSYATFYVTADWLNRHAEPDAAVLAMENSTSLIVYTKLTLLRWDNLTPPLAEKLAQHLEKTRQPVYALLCGFEQEAGLQKIAGPWREVFRHRDAAIYRRETPPPRP